MAEKYLNYTMIKNKLFVLLILGMVFISFGSAQINYLGTFALNDPIDLKQTCATCSFNNITSILYPNSTELIGNQGMNQTGSVYNFTIPSDRTSVLGRYIVNGIGDINGQDRVWEYTFDVTPSGAKQSTPEAIGSAIYLFLIISLIVMFAYMGFKLTNSDELWVFGIFLIFIALILVIYATYLNMFYYKFFIGTLNDSIIPSILFVFLLIAVTAGLIAAGLLLFKRIPEYIGKIFKGVLDKGDGWDKNQFN